MERMQRTASLEKGTSTLNLKQMKTFVAIQTENYFVDAFLPFPLALRLIGPSSILEMPCAKLRLDLVRDLHTT
jgi:hypothetical protein